MSEPTPGPLCVGNTSGRQGLIVEEGTGRNVAVTYDKDDAPRIAKAVNHHDELVAALRAYTEADGMAQCQGCGVGGDAEANARGVLAKLEATE